MKDLLNLPDTFWSQDRKTYFHYDEDGKQKVGGYYRNTGNFTFMTVPKAGHFVPFGNYDADKAVLDDFVNHNKLLCKFSKYKVDISDAACRSVADMCSMMNQCSDHGICHKANGTCECKFPYKGADCSYDAIQATFEAMGVYEDTKTKGQQYIYFVAPKITDGT
jgi:hypothetical protein